MSDSRPRGRRWPLIVLGVAIVVLLGGGGVAGVCKLYVDCRTGNLFHQPGPVNVSQYNGKGAGAMGLPSDLQVQVFAKGFRYPTDAAFLPDGRLLVAAKDGLITVVSKDGTTSAPFLDLRARVNSMIFRGIVDVTVDPDFGAHPFLYVIYTAIGSGPKSTAPTVIRISRFTVGKDGADPASERVIVGTAGTTSCLAVPRTADCLPSEVDHDGADIAFAPDGTLFISTGDGGGEEKVEKVAFLAQDPDTLGGKVLHVDRDGRGLPTNPFWNGDPRSNRSRVWAVGFRNPFRLTLLAGRESSPLVADVGWNTWERLAFATRGANLGWPCYEARERTKEYGTTQFCASFYRSHPQAPTAPWIALHHPRGESITGGLSLTRATALPERYRQDYVFGDWANSSISLVPLSKAGRPVRPTVLARNAAGPVSFAIGPDGALYYVAANLGEVRRLASASG